MKKSDVISKLIKIKPSNLTLAKASAAFGGGLLTPKENGHIGKIMLRRSKNYLDDYVSENGENLFYDSLSWYTVDLSSIALFDSFIFVNFDNERGYFFPLIFSKEDMLNLVAKFSVTQKKINIYIQKKKNKNEFILTRFGNELGDESLEVTSNYLCWEKI